MHTPRSLRGNGDGSSISGVGHSGSVVGGGNRRLSAEFGAFQARKFSVFVTTYNLGEAKLAAIQDNLADWIIPGHDIYSIGVQECLDLGVLRSAILSHLGGAEAYTMFCTEIG